MIDGVHVVRKKRNGKPPIWYVYAYRGGPQIHREVGWKRPALGREAIQRLTSAHDARVKQVKAPETLMDLLRLWRPRSPEWQNLSKTTQKTWGSILDVIETKWGQTPLTVWNDPRMTSRVVAWRDSRSDTPRAADNGVVVLRALLKFGRLRGKVTINVAEGIPQLYRNGTRSEIVWTDEDVDAFAKASRELRMEHVLDGLKLAALTGLRRADLVSLTWEEVMEEVIVKKAAKVSRGRRRTATIPRLDELDELLGRLKARHRADGVNTVLVNSFGRPWSADGFGTSFNRVRDHAGIAYVDPDTGERRMKHLHDVRGTFCTKLIRAGLENHVAAEVMGWSPDQVAGIRRSYVDQGQVVLAIAGRLRGKL